MLIDKPDEVMLGLPDMWRCRIVAAVNEAVGAAQVFLIGSRARGEAHTWSDCDVSVVLPSRKVLTAVRRLQVVSATLSQEFEVSVSINPVPRLLLHRARHNLYILKIRLEGIRLETDPAATVGAITAANSGFGTRLSATSHWDTHSKLARYAEVSYLLSAAHTLIAGIEPHTVSEASLDAGGEAALRKAAVQVAQACILATGQYVASSRDALVMAEDLGILPGNLTGFEGFLRLRSRLLQILGPTPVRISGLRVLARDIQYAALSALKGRRWLTTLWHHRGIEGRLASASIHLLQSLSEAEPYGYDANLVLEASLLLPPNLRPETPTYENLRSLILSEWSTAQPLVGVIP